MPGACSTDLRKPKRVAESKNEGRGKPSDLYTLFTAAAKLGVTPTRVRALIAASACATLFALDGRGGKASAARAAAAVRERVKLNVQLGLRTEGPAQIRHLGCRIGLSGNVLTLAVSGSSVTII